MGIGLIVGILFATGMAAVDPPTCRTDPSVQSEIERITRMEHDRTAAGQRKDLAAVIPVTEDDYTQIDQDGRLLGREATFARIKGSQMRIASNSLDHIVVRICGDTAVVTGQAHPRGEFQGRPFNPDVAYSRIYLRRGGKWRVIHFQQTRIAN